MGPAFTGGINWELCTKFEQFNGDNKCCSRPGEPGYNITYKDGKNMLTNKSIGDLTITELEVWEVNFIVI